MRSEEITVPQILEHDSLHWHQDAPHTSTLAAFMHDRAMKETPQSVQWPYNRNPFRPCAIGVRDASCLCSRKPRKISTADIETIPSRGLDLGRAAHPPYDGSISQTRPGLGSGT